MHLNIINLQRNETNMLGIEGCIVIKIRSAVEANKIDRKI